jgi:glycerol-3-phosphate acyltransferase PlsY
MENTMTLLAIGLAYLLGSISSAIIVCKLMNLPDPRVEGSRNPGATNVLRIGGKKPAIITLVGDALKGFIPVLIAHLAGFNPFALSLVAFAAFLGHLYPVFFKFEGGKGVATYIGGLLALSPLAGLCWIGTWLSVALMFRFSSVAAFAASLLAPVFVWYFTDSFNAAYVFVLMSILVFYRHRSNMVHLWQGTEKKIGEK